MLPTTIPSAFAGDSRLEPVSENVLVEGVIDLGDVDSLSSPRVETGTPEGDLGTNSAESGASEPLIEQGIDLPRLHVDAVEPPLTFAIIESLDLMTPLAISDPGFYTVGDDAVPLTVYVDDTSTNTHSIPTVL